jgi:acetylornithine deacetylase/succinyl-diaminopimelate desuccinylase-like protein
MHQVNERVETRDIETLTDIYEGVLARYFDRV